MLHGSESGSSDTEDDIVGQLLSGSGAPSLGAIRNMQNSGKISENDNSTFCSKFVDPSSSDTDDECLADFNVELAKEKELESAILGAAKSGLLKIVEEVLKRDAKMVAATDDDLYTPLHRAAYNGHLDVMKTLIQHGADPNAPTLDGWTPLHSASCWGKVEAANLLIKAGSRVNARSYQNTTPLHVAANRPDNRPVLELLLTTPGIDASIPNDSGDTAAQIASRIGPYGYLFEPFENSLVWRAPDLIINENGNELLA